jgi:hypothetical protein
MNININNNCIADYVLNKSVLFIEILFIESINRYGIDKYGMQVIEPIEPTLHYIYVWQLIKYKYYSTLNQEHSLSTD